MFTAVFGGVKTEVKIWGSTWQLKFSPRFGGCAAKISRGFLGVGFLASSALSVFSWCQSWFHKEE